MQKIVLTFGLISGGIQAVMMAVMVPLYMNRIVGFDKGEVIGYTSMILSFLLVFFGIRTYRENAGGAITFGKAFKVGILITLITCAIYVVTWQIIYYNFFPNFMDVYAQHTVAGMQAGGASDAVILAKQQEMARFKELYANPLFNVGITFLEIFPVGLIVTLVSAAILRKKPAPGAPPYAAAAA